MFDFFDNFKKVYYRNRGQKLLLRGEPKKAYPYLEKALILDDSPSNMYNLALALLAMRRYKEAERYLSMTVEKTPGNALAALTLCDLYMQKKEWDRATEILTNLCDAYPSNQSYRKYLELISDPKQRDKYIKAKELLNKAKDSIDEGKFDRALNQLLQAEKLDPKNPYIQSNLGSLYFRVKNDPKKAFEHFHKAYTLNPENRGFKENLEMVRKEVAKMSSR